MPFVKKPQVFSAKINELTLGTGDQAVTLGGQNVYNLYAFDGEIANRPKIGNRRLRRPRAALRGPEGLLRRVRHPGPAGRQGRGAEDVDFVCIRFDMADPNGANKSIEDCVADAKAVAEAVSKPIVVAGCKNAEKDADLFSKVSEALQGKNILVLSAKEENYKGIAAGAGLAYGQKVGAESAVDINLAKQLNVLITQMGVDGHNVAMNIGSAAAGYGFEYVVSTLERVKAAALSQNDTTLQMPIITPVGVETWGVKESNRSREREPRLGRRRGAGRGHGSGDRGRLPGLRQRRRHPQAPRVH